MNSSAIYAFKNSCHPDLKEIFSRRLSTCKAKVFPTRLYYLAIYGPNITIQSLFCRVKPPLCLQKYHLFNLKRINSQDQLLSLGCDKQLTWPAAKNLFFYYPNTTAFMVPAFVAILWLRGRAVETTVTHDKLNLIVTTHSDICSIIRTFLILLRQDTDKFTFKKFRQYLTIVDTEKGKIVDIKMMLDN